MGETLSWELLARDRMSDVIEKLDRTLDKLDRNMLRTGEEAQAMGRKLGEAEPHASRLSGGLDRLSSGAEKAIGWIKNVGVTAGLAFGVAAVAGGAFAIKSAADNETARISFEVLLGSQQKAMSFLKDLQQFAAATPFDMPSLRDAASRLLAVGVATKDVIPLMTQLGNATAGMGTGAEGISRAVYALQQIKQGGIVHAGDIMQLTDAGIPALDALAAHFHKTVADVKKMVETNQVKPEDLFGAIEKGEGPAFERLHGMMDKQSSTLTGVWSTFKDNLQQTLATTVEPVLPKLKKLLDFGSQAIPKVIDGIKQFAGKIGEIFKGSDVGEKIMAALEKFGKDILPEIKKSANDVLKVIRENKDGLEKFGHMIANDVIPFVEKLAKVSLITLTTGIIIVIEAVAHFVDAWNTGRSIVVGAVRGMVAIVLGSFEMLLTGASKAFGWIPGIGDKLRGAAREFHDFVNGVDAELGRLQGKTVNTYVNTYYSSYGSVLPGAPGGRNAIRASASGGIGDGGSIRVGENGPEELYMGGPWRVKPNNQITPGGGSADVIGVLEVRHIAPTGELMRTEFLKLANRKGYRTLDKLLPVGS